MLVVVKPNGNSVFLLDHTLSTVFLKRLDMITIAKSVQDSGKTGIEQVLKLLFVMTIRNSLFYVTMAVIESLPE